jgi:D-serine deaminase-like pyridoxal phosphate-dependent protein
MKRMNITHPTLLLDKRRCQNNIAAMAKKAADHGLQFKPHFKTHQSKKVGEWLAAEGVTGITVSSIAMAQYFADEGWKDITIAFPVNILAMDEINTLAGKVELTVLVNNLQAAEVLRDKLDHEVNVLIELDAGSKRTGIDPGRREDINELINILQGILKLKWKGFYSHFGHTYKCRGTAEVRKVFKDSLEKINIMIEKGGFKGADLHIGDTPGCSLVEKFSGITTITPGNFVFYDVMQQRIGSCTSEQVGVAMACPVVEKKEKRCEITIHGGAVHFSKDSIIVNDEPCFGVLVNLSETGIGSIENGRLVGLSQEHGTMKVSKELFGRINVGDIIGVLPIHSCLTAECMKGYQDFEGNAIDHL